ncbi:hypothetical protein ZWY2020_038694 [Hordeum vulgare]|nr:hypothetical protein ZWY2020_038694 [Hordeum vulgare]
MLRRLSRFFGGTPGPCRRVAALQQHHQLLERKEPPPATPPLCGSPVARPGSSDMPDEAAAAAAVGPAGSSGKDSAEDRSIVLTL